MWYPLFRYYVWYLLLFTSIHRSTHIKSVVKRYLVIIAHYLIQRGVVEGGGHVPQQGRHGLAGVKDVAICPQYYYEPIQCLQHQMCELLVGEELWLPVSLYLLGLKIVIIIRYKYLTLVETSAKECLSITSVGFLQF